MYETSYSGLNNLKLETIENGICLEDVKFKKISTQMNFNTGVTVKDEYYPISANSSSDINVYYFNGYIKMNIPKLMPFHNVKKPYDSNVNVDKNIIINSKDTKPVILGKITVCNYIRVKAPSVLFTRPGFKYGDTISCVFPNKNLKNPSFLPI